MEHYSTGLEADRPSFSQLVASASGTLRQRLCEPGADRRMLGHLSSADRVMSSYAALLIALYLLQPAV